VNVSRPRSGRRKEREKGELESQKAEKRIHKKARVSVQASHIPDHYIHYIALPRCDFFSSLKKSPDPLHSILLSYACEKEIIGQEVYGRGDVDQRRNLENQGSEAGGGCHTSERGLTST
jgi:hypothetical protein